MKYPHAPKRVYSAICYGAGFDLLGAPLQCCNVETGKPELAMVIDVGNSGTYTWLVGRDPRMPAHAFVTIIDDITGAALPSQRRRA